MVKMDNKSNQQENQLIIGRNAVLEALKSDRTIDTLLVAKGEHGGSVGRIIAACRDKSAV